MRRHLATAAFLIAIAGLTSAARADEPGQPLQRIAFGSCAHQDRPQPIWEAIVAARPQLFIFGGDTVYADTVDMQVMRTTYAQLAALPGWQKLRKSCPVIATWDDHDYGADDAGAEYPKKDESQQIFLDFFDVPKDSPRRKQQGVYHAQLFGPPEQRVQVILMDTRYFRSKLKKSGKFLPRNGPYVPNPDPDATFLGKAQWQWLEQQLRVPAKLRLILSSIQLVAEDHGFEKWMNLPRERERFFKLLADTRANGVVILSGDRHLGELSVMDAGIGYPLYDLTSSGLNQGAPRWRSLEVNRHRVATMGHGNNFGMVVIDWDRKDPLIRLQIRDEQGEVTIQEKVLLSLLQPGKIRKVSAPAHLLSGEALTRVTAAEHVGKKVTIEMKVRATGASAGSALVFLNSSENRTSPENFTVVLDKDAQAKLKAAGVAEPRRHFEGKTIQVSGTLALFREQPEIVVSDPAQVRIVGATTDR